MGFVLCLIYNYWPSRKTNKSCATLLRALLLTTLCHTLNLICLKLLSETDCPYEIYGFIFSQSGNWFCVCKAMCGFFQEQQAVPKCVQLFSTAQAAVFELPCTLPSVGSVALLHYICGVYIISKFNLFCLL